MSEKIRRPKIERLRAALEGYFYQRDVSIARADIDTSDFGTLSNYLAQN
jgi:hypothetical protein